ncbi:hypothetical protein L1080_008965 [Rhodococcus sp. MSC1_016]|uniref:hypothetical protein n=1 Tax=Rhodococcus sp. MSC1_016 TaxID=2909266 RepID=UPI00202E632F|nr:hypothetical protein [Rhodococcus sp. MSC1_016]
MREAVALLQYRRAGRAMIALLEMTALSLPRPITDALLGGANGPVRIRVGGQFAPV